MRNHPTFDLVSSLLRYESETGKIFWRTDRGRAKAGQEAGNKKRDGYRSVVVNYRSCQSHLLAWLLHHGTWPNQDIDHINGVKDDNRIANLREVTKSENGQNQHRANSANKTGFLGVSRHHSKFVATIKLNGKQHRIGRFDTAEAAHQAYIAAKRRLHPAGTL